MEKNIYKIILGLILSILVFKFFGLTGYFILTLLFFINLSFDSPLDKSILIGSSLLLLSIIIFPNTTVEFTPGDKYFIEGEVINAFQKSEDYQRIEVKDKSGIVFSLGNISKEPINIYDLVRGQIEIRDNNFNNNFYLQNQENYYYINNISANGFSRELEVYNNPSIIKGIKKSIINSWEESIDNNLNEINSGIIKKLVLSDSSQIEEELNKTFQETGLSHLLAISGLHIFILIGFFEFLLKQFKIDYKIRFFIIGSVIFFYSYILGFPSSIVRAILMYLLKKFFEIIKIKVSNLSVVMISGIIILSIKPYFLFDLGFQLSFMSVIGIILLKDTFFSGTKNKLLSSFGIYLSVNVIIFPILAYHFNNFNVFSFLFNIFMTPIIISVLVLSYFALLLDVILNLSFVYIPINHILNFSNYYLNIFSKIFNYKIQVLFPNLGFVGGYYIFLFFVFNNRCHRFLYNYKREFFILFAFSISIMLSDVFFPPIYIGFYDVGQGDSSYIIYKNNYIQIDTGGSGFSNFNPGEEITTKTIINRGIDNIDLLILSHFDADHILGTESLIKNNLVDSILINYSDDNNELFLNIKNYDVNLYLPNNNPLVIDKDFTITFLNTNPPSYKDSNDKSLVLLVNFKGKKILFTGDITKEVEMEIEEKIGKIDILKVSHHGSNSSSDIRFLNKIRPNYSVISVGKNNSYGHPTDEVLENLSKVNSKILRTDKEGEIIFKISSDIDYKTYNNSILQIDYLYVFISAIISYMYILYLKKNEELNEIQRF